MYKILKNRKGSALTYVLIIMMLLSILGLSLISSTVINFKVNRMSNSFNKSFYITDGAIDETLSELKEITYRAEAEAFDWINDEDSEFREEEKWLVFFENVSSKLESKHLSSEDVVALTEEALKREYTKKYYQFLLEVPQVSESESKEIYEEDYLLYQDGNFIENSSVTLKANVKLKAEYYKDLTEVFFAKDLAENFESAKLEKIKLIQDNKKDYFSLTITSNGEYNESKKVIEVKLDVTVPEYNYIVSTKSKNVEIHKNEALDNALVARKDIIVVDGKVTVNGNIYSYGTLPNRQEYSYSDVGGILIGADNGNLNSIFTSIGLVDYTDFGSVNINGALEVDGDINTRSSIRINGVNSNLNTKGDLYANSFVVDKKANNFTSDTSKNLYMMEDMILFGDDSKITIGSSSDDNSGELWTFLRGSPSGTNKGVRDLSGSILVNNNSDDLKLTVNKYFISGVAYIDIYRNEVDVDGSTFKSYYQSGESFTTNNYNNYYTRKIASTDKSVAYFDYILARGEYTGSEVSVIETVDALGKKVDDVNYKATHFIMKNKEIENASETSLPSVSDRDKSIFTINSILSSNNKNNFALGAILGNDKIFNPYAVKDEDSSTFVHMTDYDFELLRDPNVEKLDIKVSLLATRNYTNGTNTDEKFDEIFKVNNTTVLEQINDPNNFIFINDDPTRDIYLNIPQNMRDSIKSKDLNDLVILSDNSNMVLSGAIITKGNIIVYNENNAKDFVFNGPLISEQSILTYGSGKKVFNNKSTDTSYSSQLVNLILFNDKVYGATNSSIGKKVYVRRKDGSSNPTRSIDGNLDVDIVGNDIKITPTINSNVVLEGIIKTNKAKTITINSWKEVD